MIIIHTASRYRDLPLHIKAKGKLFEYNSGVYDLSDKIEHLCEVQNPRQDIVTLNGFVVNRLGENINKGKISEQDIVVYVYKDGVKKSTHNYSHEGYLENNWDINLYYPDD